MPDIKTKTVVVSKSPTERKHKRFLLIAALAIVMALVAVSKRPSPANNTTVIPTLAVFTIDTPVLAQSTIPESNGLNPDFSSVNFPVTATGGAVNLDLILQTVPPLLPGMFSASVPGDATQTEIGNLRRAFLEGDKDGIYSIGQNLAMTAPGNVVAGLITDYDTLAQASLKSNEFDWAANTTHVLTALGAGSKASNLAVQIQSAVDAWNAETAKANETKPTASVKPEAEAPDKNLPQNPPGLAENDPPTNQENTTSENNTVTVILPDANATGIGASVDIGLYSLWELYHALYSGSLPIKNPVLYLLKTDLQPLNVGGVSLGVQVLYLSFVKDTKVPSSTELTQMNGWDDNNKYWFKAFVVSTSIFKVGDIIPLTTITDMIWNSPVGNTLSVLSTIGK